MASNQEYELAAAYVRILPSLQGLAKNLSTELNKGAKTSSTSINAIYAKNTRSLASSMASVFAGSGKILAPFTSALTGSVSAMGRQLNNTLLNSANVAGGALAAAVGAVGGQIVAGGFSRALGLNDAEARLKAMGYSLQEIQRISSIASKAVEGTSYTMADAFGAAGPLISAGIKPGQELASVLDNITKLADMSGRSFSDLSTEMVKNSAAGVVQYEDLLRVIDKGVDIMTPLSKQLGVSTKEVKKMASASKISFKQFNDAISSIDFDSAIFAANSLPMAFKNTRSQLSKIGATLWQPIVEGLVPILNQARGFLVDFQKDYGNQLNSVARRFEKGFDKLEVFFESFKRKNGTFDTSPITNRLNEMVVAFDTTRDKLKGLEGPMFGIMAGLAGTMLRSVPLVGGLFSSLTVPVGLFGGTLIAAYRDSKPLQGSLDKLYDSGKNVLDVLLNRLMGESGGTPMKSLGDKLAKGVDYITGLLDRFARFMTDYEFGGSAKALAVSIGDSIGSFIETIASRGPEMLTAISGIFDALRDSFSNDGEFTASDLADTLVDVFVTVAGVIESMIPIVARIASAVSKIITSDAVKGFFSWLGDLASWVGKHETAVSILIGLFGVWFVGKKLLATPMLAFFVFMLKMKQYATILAAFGGAAAKMTAGMIVFFKGMSAVGKAAIGAIPGLLGVGAFILVAGAIFGALGWLIEKFDIVNQLEHLADALMVVVRFLVDAIAYAIDSLYNIITDSVLKVVGGLAEIWPAFEPGDVIDRLIDMFERFGSELINLAGIVVENLPLIIDSLRGLTVDSLGAFTNLLNTLATSGAAAGAGAFAAAAGIAALMASISTGGVLGAGANMLSSIGNLGAGLVNKVGEKIGLGKADKAQTPLTMLSDLLGLLIQANSVIMSMPQSWGMIAESAYLFGVDLINAIITAFSDMGGTLYSAFDILLTNMLVQAQAKFDANPIELRFSGAPKLTAGGEGGGGRGGSVTNNNNTFYSRNDDVIRKVARAGR